jgi:biopolymer transport protein ExbD
MSRVTARLLLVVSSVFAVAGCGGRESRECGPTHILLTFGSLHMWSDESGEGIALHDETSARDAVRKATHDGCSTKVRISAAEDVTYGDLVAIIDVSLAAGRTVSVDVGGEVEVAVPARPDAAAIARAPHLALTGTTTVSLDGSVISAYNVNPDLATPVRYALERRVEGERFVVIEADRRASISVIKEIARGAKDAGFAVLFTVAR